MPVTTSSDPKQAGQGIEAFAQDPQKAIPAPTLTDAEARRIEEALARGRFSKEIQLGPSLKVKFSSLTDEEDMVFRTQKEEMLETARIKLMEAYEKRFGKDKIFPTDAACGRMAEPEVMKLNLSLHLKELNDQPVGFKEATAAVYAWPTTIVNLLLTNLDTMYKDDLELGKKAIASSSNIKK